MGIESSEAGFRNIVNMSFVKHSDPKITMPKAPRFVYSKLEDKEESPTTKLSRLDGGREVESVCLTKKGPIIGTSKRSDFTLKKDAIETPGPGQYDVARPSIALNQSSLS